MPEKLKILLLKGKELYDETNQFRQDFPMLNGMHEARLLDVQYNHWIDDLKATLEPKDLPQSIFGEHVVREWNTGSKVNDFEHFLRILSQQLDHLVALEVKDMVRVDAEGSVTVVNSGRSYRFDSNKKRFRLLYKLARENKNISGTLLRKEFNYSVNTLSKEKREINSILREKLGLNEFITKRGYQINPLYSVSVQ